MPGVQTDDYQPSFSEQHAQVLSWGSRRLKAQKIVSVIKSFYQGDTGQLSGLDVGCSGGIITSYVGNFFDSMVGIDIDTKAVQFACGNCSSNKAKFLIADTMRLPFKDSSFDFAICNHVYEHVPDPQRLFDEIHRVLKLGGFCYLAASNKYGAIEPHYSLPFLSWLPKKLANWYLRLTFRGRSYGENLLSKFQLKKLIGKFNVYEYTYQIIKNPEKYHAFDMIRSNSIIPKLPRWIIDIFAFIIPTYILILERGCSRKARKL